MKDSIVISATCADAASPDSLPSDGQKADAAFGSFLVHYLDHADFEAHSVTERGRHTRISHRLSRLVPRLLAQSGLSAEDIAGTRTGLVSGSSYGCAQVFEMHQRLRRHGPRGVDAVRFAQATHNYPVSACAIEFGLQGPCLSVVSTETAGLDALQCAFDWLRDDRCDRVLVVAYEDMAPPIADHLVTRAMATPGKAYGEAMVLILLERDSIAAARGHVGRPVLASVVNTPRPEFILPPADVTTRCATATAAAPSSRTLDYLGAGGLLAIHDLLNSPDAGQQGDATWQIDATATAGCGVAVGIRVSKMEPAL
ncbi:beta-ketoacyl synthase N-terminal-like domain-containing protein [Thalassococcus sp. BH17M4-6]|uniref:beta-ketoacyl synthase N-terminal-like domain-containing protein n=1 Tax=Thalassococcus sp. BH17M4-6 TaxID=3413148 RepID=UPI003BE96AC2